MLSSSTGGRLMWLLGDAAKKPGAPSQVVDGAGDEHEDGGRRDPAMEWM
jgi:hypothetical protein